MASVFQALCGYFLLGTVVVGGAAMFLKGRELHNLWKGFTRNDLIWERLEQERLADGFRAVGGALFILGLVGLGALVRSEIWP